MLRHLLGLSVGLIATPLLWAGAAWSTAEIAKHVQAQQFSDPLLLTACAAMMGVGLTCGVLAGTRISPLAAFFSGSVLLGASLWPLLDYVSMNAVVPEWLAAPGSLFHPMGPVLPVALALGTLLFISALAPSRWRSPRRLDEAAAPPYPPVPPPARPEADPPVPPQSDDPYDSGWVSDDPSRTTTPFRRDSDGFQPIDQDGPDRTQTFGDNRY